MNKRKLGIIGGGQLGRMLIGEAIRYDLEINVLDPDPMAPCHKLANSFTCGSLVDFETVYSFGKKCNVVTIEIENVNTEALEKLEQEGILVYPQPSIIKLIKDKGHQKEFYRDNQIPTPEFKLIHSGSQLRDFKNYLPFVQKLRIGGYDGRGVAVMKSETDFEFGFDAPSVLEKFVDFEKEIAVIAGRNSFGEVGTFPVVELEFNPAANLVEILFSPADISNEVEIRAREIAVEIISKLQLVGVLAVEMFLCKNGEILVNEIAPRPHNSGHQTIEGNFTSQYEQHLRAILGLPLGSTDLIMPSVMINLLGEQNFSGPAVYEGIQDVLKLSGTYIHLYGKKDTKPFRKMGHVTVLDRDIAVAREKATLVKNTLRVISS